MRATQHTPAYGHPFQEGIFANVNPLLRGVARSVGVCLSAITLLLTGCATRLPPPIETGAIERTTPDGPVRGLWARVRLDHPDVEIVTTAPLAAAASNPAGAEARLITVPKWAEAEHTTLAINANFFGVVVPSAPGEKDPGWFAGRPVDLRGLSVRDGVVVSPPRVTGGRGDPAVVFYADGHARVAPVTDKDLTGVTGAVAGLGPGDLLVTDGRNTGATSLVQPRVRHPRTAAGVSADGRTLILLVIDGRQPGHSIGVTLPELADLMIGLGATAAVNLDGGGSSTFYYRAPDGKLLANHVKGGVWRPVGNHLGVRLKVTK